MRFHCLGVPHTVTSHEYVGCAYTQKILKFAKMMKARGHYIIHYGHEESDLECDEHVTVVTKDDYIKSYGNHDWRKNFFKFSMGDYAYKKFFENAIREVGLRKQKNDFILPFWGAGGRPVCDAHPDIICVEPGIGYADGHWSNFKIFESYAIYHAYYGLGGVKTAKHHWYDVVIPNYFDTDDFEFREDKEDYYLFIGRVCDGKGVQVAVQVTEKIGAKLIIAGQNSLKALGFEKTPDHVTEYGYAGVEERKKLMAGAKAAFVPSMYTEPFGGVQVELLMSGTPTITTDWGAFSENNIHGVTGYRCRTFEQFCWAAKNIDNIKPSDCRNFAMNFTFDKIAPMYEEYFQNVLNIYTGNGWYEPNPYRQSLDYLKKDLSPPEKSSKKLVINSHQKYQTFLEKLFETLQDFEEDIIVVVGGSDIEVPPYGTVMFDKKVTCVEIKESNFDFNGFIALNRYKDDPLILSDGYMYIHDTCKADRSFPIRFKELKIEPNSTYVFGHEHDIENLANQSFICAFSYDIIEKYGDSFDTVVSKEVAIGMEAGTGPSITKFGNVKYVGKRKTFFLSDHYDEGKLRYKSFYKEFGIYKFHTCDDDLHLDFLEIGTSDFDVETDLSKKGMFVEPIGKYLKRLPEQIKINAAITHDKDCDTCNVFYIDDVDIQKNNLPQWLKGCNSIHKPHAFHEKFSHLVKKSEVKLLNISELFQIYKIKSLKKLKIDTEGHDTVIMKGLYEYLKTAPFSAKPHDIIFETNEHTSTEAVDETVRLMKEHGYKLFERGFDTHLKLVRTAVLSETVYALGKIHTSLQRRMEHCDFIDWNNHSQITNFMKNWKDYGCIISTTSLMKLDIDDPEFYKRTMFVVHYPSTSNDHFKERLNDKMIHKGGVSKEISKMLDVPFLPCGYDPDVFTFERFPKELKTIGFVGKYDPGSIYEDTKRSEMFKKIATSVGIEYKFITGITDPKKLYNDVDLIVCTSTAEGGPLGPIEAGAIGVPSISTPVGNMVDIESIRKYNTIEEAVDIIRGFIENPSTFQEYSEKVHKEITEKWNWNYIFKTYWDKEIKSILQTTRA